MTRETYEVSTPLNGGPPRRRSDNSFWLCLFTMIIVLSICITVLFFCFSLRWCELGFFCKGDNHQYSQTDRMRYVTTMAEKVPGTSSSENTSNNVPYISKNAASKTNFSTTLTTNIPTSTTSKIIDNNSTFFGATVIPTNKITESGNNESTISTTTTTIRNVNDHSKPNKLNYIAKTSTTETNDINGSFSNIKNKVSTNSSNNILSTSSTETPVNGNVKQMNVGGNSSMEGTTQTNKETKKSTPETQTELSSKLKKRILKDQEICNSTSCDLTAARIISLMDYSNPPCENFYEFACGGISANKQEELDIFLPKVLNSESNPEFMAKFNTFYQSCLRHEDRFNYQNRMKKAKQLLSTIGSFHFDGETNEKYNITEFVANLILFKAMPLFEVDIDIDPEDSEYILKVVMPDQTSLKFEHWSTLSESKRKCLRETNENAVGSPLNMTLLYRGFRSCQANYSDFFESLDTAVLELGIFSHLTEMELFKQIRDIRIFIEFEIFPLLEEIASPPTQKEMIVRRKYEKIKLVELEKEFPLIEWEKLFRMISNENITKETVIHMFNRNYFEDVFRGLSQLNKRLLNNAFLAILAHSLYDNTVIPSHKHTRTDYCKERSQELMPDILNYLYKKVIPTEELNEHNEYAKEIYSDLAKSFNESLDNLEWLDDLSKASIRKKLDDIKLVMFRNDDVENEEAFLLEGYRNLSLKDSDYQHNFFNLMKYRRKRLFSLQGQKVTSENMYRYFVDATKAEPVFFYANDIVCIPYGLTKRALRDLPRYIVLSQIGFPLAKIIGHAFDSIGIKYRVQLSETANISYMNFADQTRDMIVLSNPIKFGNQEFYFSLNNALSESERIAENTALRLLTNSFSTFKNDSLLPWISYKYNKEQIFFMTMTQEFCRTMGFTGFMIEAYESDILPPQFRIENILGNSEEFLKQFNCRPGSAMTRIEDRLQFPYLTALSKEDLDYMN